MRRTSPSQLRADRPGAAVIVAMGFGGGLVVGVLVGLVRRKPTSGYQLSAEPAARGS